MKSSNIYSIATLSNTSTVHLVLASWIQEGTYLSVNSLYWHFISGPPSQAILVPHCDCGEPPRTHSLHSSSQLDTHKDTKLLTHKSLITRAQAP